MEPEPTPESQPQFPAFAWVTPGSVVVGHGLQRCSEHGCLSPKVPEHGRVTISVVIFLPSGGLQCRLYCDVCLPQRYFLGGRSTLSWMRALWAPLLNLIKTVLGHHRARQRLYIPLPSARSSAATGSLWPGIVGFLWGGGCCPLSHPLEILGQSRRTSV